MKAIILATAAALVAVPAAAQDAETTTYGGVTAGWHTLQDIDLSAFGGVEPTEVDSAVFGVFLGVGTEFSGFGVGVEGNFSFGNDAIDHEYGAAVVASYPVADAANVFLRGGYQWVKLDPTSLGSDAADARGLSTAARRDPFIDGVQLGLEGNETDSGFLLGVGTDVAWGENFMVRFSADTIEFDTLKLSVGYGFRF